MTNDLTTLSGALLEMKDELIYQLGQKGVTATYSSTDGLLGLIGRIADIQTGGGGTPCYNVSFTDNSWGYTDYNFSTGEYETYLEVYLQYNYEPYVGQITISNEDTGDEYTLTTNAQGKATVTMVYPTGNYATSDYVVSFGNYSTDTLTVKKSTFWLIDSASTSTLSNYGSSVPIYKGTNGNPLSTLSYDSTLKAYKIVAGNTSTSYYSQIPFTACDGKTDYVVDCLIYGNASNTNADAGLFVGNSDKTVTNAYGYGATMNVYNNRITGRRYSLGTAGATSNISVTGSTLAIKTWYHMRMTVTDLTIKIELFTTSGTKLAEVKYDQAVSNKQVGFFLRGGSTTNSVFYFKEIKVRSFATS